MFEFVKDKIFEFKYNRAVKRLKSGKCEYITYINDEKYRGVRINKNKFLFKLTTGAMFITDMRETQIWREIETILPDYNLELVSPPKVSL